jgi:hypothetical protein
MVAAFEPQLPDPIRRNLDRFPAIRRLAWGGRRTAPYAFTEHGAIMAATVLNSPRAVEVSVYVVRAFVRLREMIAANKELAKKLQELERRLDTHDQAITEIMHAIRQLMAPPETKKRPSASSCRKRRSAVKKRVTA